MYIIQLGIVVFLQFLKWYDKIENVQEWEGAYSKEFLRLFTSQTDSD